MPYDAESSKQLNELTAPIKLLNHNVYWTTNLSHLTFKLGQFESRNSSNIIKLTGVIDAAPGKAVRLYQHLWAVTLKPPGLLVGQQVKG